MLKRHELQSDLRRNLVSVAHIRPLSSISFRVLASTSSVGLGRNAITQLTTVTIDEETAYYTSPPVLRVGLFSGTNRVYLILLGGTGYPELERPAHSTTGASGSFLDLPEYSFFVSLSR